MSAPDQALRRRQIARAEPVGSLLRSPAVTDAVRGLYGEMTSAVRHLVSLTKAKELQALNLVADQEITRLVERQIDAGLDVITDGEIRRSSFLSSFYDAVEGLAESGNRRETLADEKAADGTAAKINRYTDPAVVGRVRKVSSPLAEEATFMRAVTDFPFKVTLPAPSCFYLHFNAIVRAAYKSRHEFIEDVIEIEKALLADAVAAGAHAIQLDFPVYAAFVDEHYTAGMQKDVGCSFQELFDRAISADRRVIEDLPDDVATGLHLCRGNFVGGFWSGSIAPFAERMFSELPYDRFLFEWEDREREGGYEPIKYLPKGRTMVMGLVSTKTPHVEDVDEIVRRIDEAARYLDVSQLALCPQCGFASLYGSNLVEAEEAQWRKLELIGNVANRVWAQ